MWNANVINNSNAAITVGTVTIAIGQSHVFQYSSSGVTINLPTGTIQILEPVGSDYKNHVSTSWAISVVSGDYQSYYGYEGMPTIDVAIANDKTFTVGTNKTPIPIKAKNSTAGGSTDLITYLNYMSTWEKETDDNIDCLIAEQALFVNLNDFNSDGAVEAEFKKLLDLACAVRDHTIAADALQISADAAAVAAIWTFGFGMAAFMAFEAAATIEKGIVSSKSKDLNEKLKTIDTDISAQISDNVNQFVVKYKTNNTLIVSKAPAGLDLNACRSNLMQFMATVQKKSGAALTAQTFKQYAASARIIYNSDEIQKVYDAIDELNLSGRTDVDVKKFIDVLSKLTYPPEAMSLILNISFAIMAYKLNIANTTIRNMARDAGLPVEEVDASAFEVMDSVGKFATAVAVVLSVVDVVFQVLNIVDVVEQCKKMCDEISNTIKPSYQSFFNSIKDASKQYRAAVGLEPKPPAIMANRAVAATAPMAAAPVATILAQQGAFAHRNSTTEETEANNTKSSKVPAV